MTDRATYLVARSRGLIDFLMSWRGILLVIGAGLMAGGVVVDRLGWLLTVAGAACWLVVLAVLGSRIGDMYRRLGLAETALRALPDPRGIPAPVTVAAPAAPVPEPVGWADALARVAAIRARLPHDEARSRLEVAAPPPLPASDGPMVTVVVPVYNEERFVEECLRSVQQQAFTSWRCIVVDDASTDHSVARIRAAIAGDDRFHLVRHFANSGLPSSRNTGLALADTPYVTFLDGDDLILADSLADRVAAALAVTDGAVAGVYCGVKQYPETVRLDDLPPQMDWTTKPAFRDFISVEGECPFNAHAPLLRTDLLKSFGGFDESMLHGAEDWELWLRLMRNGYYFTPSTAATAIYRQKQASMVRRMPAEHLGEADRLLRSALQPLDPSHLIPDAPHPLDQPVPHYQAQIRFAKRILIYAGMAALTDDPNQLEQSLAYLEPGSYDYLDRHLDIRGIVFEGVKRGLGASNTDAQAIRADVDPIIDHVVHRLRQRTMGRGSRPDAATTADVGPVFLPQNAFQAALMADLAAQIPDASFVTFDRIDGTGGANTLLDDRKVPWQSHTAWALSGSSASIAVVMRPYAAAVAEVVERLADTGGRTIEIEHPDYTLDDLECAEVARPGEVVVAAELATVVADPRPATPLRTRNRTRDRLETGRLHEIEEYPDTLADGGRMRDLHNIFAGERCFIIGNGPSLNQLDLSKMGDDRTFAVNGIFLAADKMRFDPTFYVVEDTSVLKENLEAIKAYPASYKIFPSIYRNLVGEADHIYYFMMNRGFYEQRSQNYCVPRFSTDPGQRLYAGQSVTIINLQLAYYFGFSEVYLIGMDFSYVIPDSAERKGDVLTSTEDDPNHFHPDYFGKGKTWKDPKLDRVLANYRLADAMFRTDGRRIVNATAGGKLEIFPRVDYDSLF